MLKGATDSSNDGNDGVPWQNSSSGKLNLHMLPICALSSPCSEKASLPLPVGCAASHLQISSTSSESPKLVHGFLPSETRQNKTSAPSTHNFSSNHIQPNLPVCTHIGCWLFLHILSKRGFCQLFVRTGCWDPIPACNGPFVCGSALVMAKLSQALQCCYQVEPVAQLSGWKLFAKN